MTPEAWKVVMYLGLGLLAKIAWDWMSTGRVSPNKYMTVKHCDVNRSLCNPVLFQREFSAHKATITQKLKEFEKRLDAGGDEFKKITKCIVKMDKNLAVLTALYAKQYEKKPTTDEE